MPTWNEVAAWLDEEADDGEDEGAAYPAIIAARNLAREARLKGEEPTVGRGPDQPCRNCMGKLAAWSEKDTKALARWIQDRLGSRPSVYYATVAAGLLMGKLEIVPTGRHPVGGRY